MTNPEADLIAMEIAKCRASPYYFATTYLQVIDSRGNKHPFTTLLTEDEFNKEIKELTFRSAAEFDRVQWMWEEWDKTLKKSK